MVDGTAALITPLYAAILGLLYAVLSIRVLRLRRRLKISLGGFDHPVLLRAMRVQANCGEYFPLTILLIFFLEMSGAHGSVIHLFASSLVVGRLIHAVGVSREPEDFRFRVAGMALTFFALIGASSSLLVMTWARMGA